MKAKTPRRIRQSIRLDPVHPADLRQLNFKSSCEDCTHFDQVSACTIGWQASLHRREEQMRTYHLNGKMALCRFMEID